MTEICNSPDVPCDDDRDGLIDEGLNCAPPDAFQEVCVPGPIAMAFGTTDRGAEYDWAVPTRYAGHINTFSAHLHHNSKVSTLYLRFDELDIHQTDVLTILGPVSGWQVLSASVEHIEPVPMLTGPGGEAGTQIAFNSGAAFAARGFNIYRADIGGCTRNQFQGTSPLFENVESIALLSATNDTVFFEFPGGPDPITIWMTEVGASFEGELYVRLNYLPTRTLHLATSTNHHGGEFIRIETPTTGQTIKVAVHSRAGAGSAVLRYARTKMTEIYNGEDHHGAELLVSSEDPLSPDEEVHVRAVLAATQRYYFGLTEGKSQLDHIRLVPGGNACNCGFLQGCRVCLLRTTGRSMTDQNNNVQMGRDRWFDSAVDAAARTLVHELGHAWLGLPDEYRDHGLAARVPECWHGDSQCMHTAMCSSQIGQNLCIATDHGRDFGVANRPDWVDHVRPWPACAPDVPFCHNCPFELDGCEWLGQACTLTDDSGWARMSSRVVNVPTNSQNNDNYVDFQGFPFQVLP